MPANARFMISKVLFIDVSSGSSLSIGFVESVFLPSVYAPFFYGRTIRKISSYKLYIYSRP